MTKKTCPLCSKEYEGYGNNGRPLIDSFDVCDECNYMRVLPARMGITNGEDLREFFEKFKSAVNKLGEDEKKREEEKQQKKFHEHEYFLRDGEILSEDEVLGHITNSVDENFDVWEYMEENDSDRYQWIEEGVSNFSMDREALLEFMEYDPRDTYYRSDYDKWLDGKSGELFEELVSEGELELNGYLYEYFWFENEKEDLTDEEILKIVNALREEQEEAEGE